MLVLLVSSWSTKVNFGSLESKQSFFGDLCVIILPLTLVRGQKRWKKMPKNLFERLFSKATLELEPPI